MQKKGDFSTFHFLYSTFFCTFALEMALDMKKILFFILLIVSFLCAHAETILLRTGARVKGEIVFQNDEVVIIRNAEGARFQYPRADVEQILENDPVADETPSGEAINDQMVSKKASILLEIAGGVAVLPSEAVGAAVSADLLVGSHHIGERHLFVGGGLGYHGVFMGENKYNFLPIQVAARIPVLESKHAPVFGLSAGYGIALSKDYLGGIYAGADFGYRCQLNPKTALALVLFAQFQQAKMQVATEIEGIPYTHFAGRSLVSSGIKMALYF